MLEDKLLVKNTESPIESLTESKSESSTESKTETQSESSTESTTESKTESKSESKFETNINKNAKVESTVNINNINKKKSKYSNKFRKISIQQNKTICFNCGRDTHKQNECTESTDIYGSQLI
jgi:hypothetical protein